MSMLRCHRRFRALLLAALYLALPASVFGVRTCTHHDGDMRAHAEHEAGATGDHASAHAGHEHHSAAEAAPEHDEHPGCACLGACSPAGALALAHSPEVIVAAAAAPAAPAAVAVDSDAVRSHLTPHVLPWSVGPPSSIG